MGFQARPGKARNCLDHGRPDHHAGVSGQPRQERERGRRGRTYPAALMVQEVIQLAPCLARDFEVRPGTPAQQRRDVVSRPVVVAQPGPLDRGQAVPDAFVTYTGNNARERPRGNSATDLSLNDVRRYRLQADVRLRDPHVQHAERPATGRRERGNAIGHGGRQRQGSATARRFRRPVDHPPGEGQDGPGADD
jgi:hypothetical protein